MSSQIAICTFSGNVRNQGLPVSGVIVRVGKPLGNANGFLPQSDAPMRSARTDARGFFQFELRPGRYSVEVTPDSSTRFLNQSLALELGNERAEFNIGLTTGFIVSGSVRTADGVPVTRGQVVLVGIEPSYRTQTPVDSEGNYSATVPRGRYHCALRGRIMPFDDLEDSVAISETFASGKIVVVDVQNDEQCDLTLKELVSLRGEVYDSTGNVVAKAKVELIPLQTDRGLCTELGLGAVCFTNESGRFIVQAEPALYEIRIDPPDGVPLFGIRQTLDLTENVVRKFPLAKGFTLRGKVMYENDALSHCLVRAQNIERDTEVMAKTDDRGQFSVNVAQGNYKLLVTAHPKDSPTVTIGGAVYSGLAPWTRMIVVGRDTRVDVRLQQGSPVHGRILNEKDELRPGARVSVFTDFGQQIEKESLEHAIVNGISDADGRYCVFLSPGQYWLVIEGDLANAHHLEVAAEAVDFDVKWRGLCRAQVEVTSEDGRVIPRCRVLFTPFGVKDVDIEAFAQKPSLRGCAFTDDRGVCEMMIPPNVYSLWCTPPAEGSYASKMLKQVSVNGDWSRSVRLAQKQSD